MRDSAVVPQHNLFDLVLEAGKAHWTTQEVAGHHIGQRCSAAQTRGAHVNPACRDQLPDKIVTHLRTKRRLRSEEQFLRLACAIQAHKCSIARRFAKPADYQLRPSALTYPTSLFVQEPALRSFRSLPLTFWRRHSAEERRGICFCLKPEKQISRSARNDGCDVPG